MNKISVVLVETANSGNLGAVARVMANFGLSELVLVKPKCSIDEEARKRAKHAQGVLKGIKVVNDFNVLKKKFDLIIGTTGKIGTDYNVVRSPVLSYELAEFISGKKGKIALVFGSEEKGLSNEHLSLCDFVVHIPSSKKYSVLNISHSVGIILYELSKSINDVRSNHVLASFKEKEVILELLDEIIGGLKFRAPSEKVTQKKVWRRIVGKSMITKRESFALIGLLKKIRKKINS